MKKLLLATILLGCTTLTALPCLAGERRDDDHVVLDLSTEGWVNTKTANVTVGVEAAMNGGAAGTMRASMIKAVADLAKGDWRLTSMNRSQDQAGMERWSATYEARLPEADLNGLSDKAKKASKAGLQLTVQNIDFTPTLEETQSTENQLRVQIYKMANDQLTALNGAIAGRNYRISLIDFSRPSMQPVAPRAYMAKTARTQMMALGANAATDMVETASAPLDRSEKLTVNAKVVYASVPAGEK